MRIPNILQILPVCSLVASFPVSINQNGWSFFTTKSKDQLTLSPQDSTENLPVISKSDLIKFHKSLIEIPSVSSNEDEVTNYLADYLTSNGLTVEWIPVQQNPPRNNLYAYIGETRQTKILVTSHVDTVPPFFPYRIEGNKIYGRGSNDDKGSVAAQTTAFLELIKEGKIKEGDASLLFVVGEEVNGIGMRVASEKLDDLKSWSTVIFGEPTERKLGVGHKGIYGCYIEVEGKAAHSGYPQLGVNANTILIKLLAELLEAELPYSDLLGNSTLNIGQITGGVASNVIPAHAEATVFIRVANDLEKVKQIIESIISKYPEAKISENSDKIFPMVKPQFLDFDVPGFENETMSYSTDIPYLTGGNFKKYLYGPGSIHTAHGASEYVTFHDLFESVKGIKKLITYSLEK